MMPQTLKNFRKFFRWLGNQDMENSMPFSKLYWSRKFIEERKLKLKDEYFVRPNSKVLMKMMKDFKTPILKQAKIAFLMSIPLVDVRLVKKLRASAETLRFDKEKRINRFKSKDGFLIMEGVHDEKTKRAAFEYIDNDDDDFETEVMPQKRVRGAPGDQNVVQVNAPAVEPTLARAEFLPLRSPKKSVKIPLFCSGVTKTKKLQPLLASEKKKIDSLKEKGWNRTKIAKSVGRSPSLVSKYINDPQGYGTRKPGRSRRARN